MSKKYNKLTVLEVFKKNGREYSKCLCECGNIKDIRFDGVVIKTVKSCGCMKNPGNKKHGLHLSKVYSAWENMISRCKLGTAQNKINRLYQNRKVCERWEKFENFFSDMGHPPDGLSLDRIDNDLGYFKENCRWTDRHTQNRNKSTNIWLEHNGKRQVLKDWSREIGISMTAIAARMKVTKDTNIILHKGTLKKGSLKCKQKSLV